MRTYSPISADPRYYPLKKVISRTENGCGHSVEALECGHAIVSIQSVYNLDRPKRRRCAECAKIQEENIANNMKQQCANQSPKIIVNNEIKAENNEEN